MMNEKAKDPLCDRCKQKMVKKGQMNSGNSKYDIWKCACGNERLMAVGVNK
jgi:hypothetical protein